MGFRAGLVAIALSALTITAGCGHKSGREVGWWQDHNLEVENSGWRRLHVHIDGGHLGTVAPFETDHYDIAPGPHEVSVRPAGLLAEEHSFGTILFEEDEVVRIEY